MYKTRGKRNKRKDKISTLLGLILFFLSFVVVPGIAGTLENRYSLKGWIIEIESDEILVEDITGNIWAFFGDGYAEGESVRITFDSNYTEENRLDDKIIKVTKMNK